MSPQPALCMQLWQQWMAHYGQKYQTQIKIELLNAFVVKYILVIWLDLLYDVKIWSYPYDTEVAIWLP